MRAVVYDGPMQVAIAEHPEPTPLEPDDAVIRVSLAGICGSDLHFFHEKAPMDRGEGLGHEAVGTVEAVGEAVTEARAGDRVVASFQIACGRCWFCEHGEHALCEEFRSLGAGILGGGLGGAQAELVLVPNADVNLLRVPDTVDDERALFVGDVLTTAVHAVRLAAPKAGETLAVIGVGPVGTCAVQAAALTAAGSVVALDRDRRRLELASGWGAATVDVGEQNPEMALADLTDGRGADVVIEAVGTPEAYDSALRVARRGGRVVVAGMYTTEQVELQLGVAWARALQIRFTGLCPVQSLWHHVMDDVASGRLDPSPLISHRLPLADAQLGYELFDRREASKVVLLP